MKPRVSVNFYTSTHIMTNNLNKIERLWNRMIVFWSGSKLTHCSIRLETEDDDISLFLMYRRAAELLPTKTLDRFVGGTPDYVFEIGELDFDLTKVERLIKGDYRVTPAAVLLWFFVTRPFCNWKPKTCATSVCEMLRAGGLDVGMHVAPVALFKELKNEFNYDSRKS